MIPYKEALALLLSKAEKGDTETLNLNQIAKRILAEDVIYDVDLPPFDKSAMDGFACRRADLGNELQMVEVIYAGKKPEKTIGKNECAKIMTGAVVPKGADCVFMVEQSEIKPEHQVICTNIKTKSNICYKAEDVKVGDLAIKKNTRLKAQHLPILAGAGIANPRVYVMPKVAVFATGSELVEPHEKPLSHQIRNTNSSQMLAQLNALGVKANYLGIIKDSKEETEAKISSAFENTDLLILSGGVSVGDYDFIPEIIEKLGFKIILTSSAIQPGKPIIFAKKGKQYCFGLAGNPVSSFVQFEIYVKPFIYALMNFDYKPAIRSASLTQNYKRKKNNRLGFIPAYTDGKNQVSIIEFHGSAHIHALAKANCLIEIPLGIGELKKGESVNVRPI